MQTTIEQEASIVRSIVEQEKDRMAEALSNYIDTLEFSYCETEEEYEQEYDYWSENIRGDVEVDIDKITPKIIDDFGENFYAFKDVDYEID